MALVQPTTQSQSRMGCQRKNRNQLSQAYDEGGGSETNDNDINLIFFVMDIPRNAASGFRKDPIS